MKNWVYMMNPEKLNLRKSSMKKKKKNLKSLFQNTRKKMQNTFNIDEIRKYILSQDSLGDVLYNLSVSKILEANEPEEEEEDDEDDFNFTIKYDL